MFDSKINGILLVLILMAAGVNLRAKTFRIGGSLSYATKNDNVKGSPSYGAFFDYKMNSLLFFKTSVNFLTTDTELDHLANLTNNQLSVGDYSLMGVEETALIYRENPLISPYAGIGVGYYITGHSLSSDATYTGYSITEEVANAPGLNFMVGFNYEPTPDFAVNLQVKNIYLRSTVTEEIDYEGDSLTVTADKEVDLGQTFISLGISLNL